MAMTPLLTLTRCVCASEKERAAECQRERQIERVCARARHVCTCCCERGFDCGCNFCSVAVRVIGVWVAVVVAELVRPFVAVIV